MVPVLLIVQVLHKIKRYLTFNKEYKFQLVESNSFIGICYICCRYCL